MASSPFAKPSKKPRSCNLKLSDTKDKEVVEKVAKVPKRNENIIRPNEALASAVENPALLCALDHIRDGLSVQVMGSFEPTNFVSNLLPVKPKKTKAKGKSKVVSSKSTGIKKGATCSTVSTSVSKSSKGIVTRTTREDHGIIPTIKSFVIHCKRSENEESVSASWSTFQPIDMIKGNAKIGMLP